jgi:hypothetical protein
MYNFNHRKLVKDGNFPCIIPIQQWSLCAPVDWSLYTFVKRIPILGQRTPSNPPGLLSSPGSGWMRERWASEVNCPPPAPLWRLWSSELLIKPSNLYLRVPFFFWWRFHKICGHTESKTLTSMCFSLSIKRRWHQLVVLRISLFIKDWSYSNTSMQVQSQELSGREL